MSVIVEKEYIKEIPIIKVFNSHSIKPLPVILMLHGATGRKEDNLDRAKWFANEGFFIVLFDAYEHGELKSNNRNEIEDIEKIFKLYLETSKYITTIINYFMTQNSIGDFRKVGLIGFSMGAHTVYYHILKERHSNIKIAIAVIGSPVWRSFVKRFVSMIINLKTSYNDIIIKEKEEKISEIQPIKFIDNIQELPLIMLNGELDDKIPIQEIEDSYNKLKLRYREKSKIEYIKYKNTGHKVTDNMIETALNRFKKYLFI